ncbi:MAG: hypothetical protein D6744_05310 [Planctomycetota bacterium]|nr:MAG: hypothetical protein D6744_05310 [Planctomycetota bacterium]
MSVNPFSETAMKIDMPLSWRTWAGGSTAATAAACVAIAALVLAALHRFRRGVPAAWILVLVLVAIGGFRTVDGLRGAGFVSPTERAYRDLQTKRAAGESLQFPIDLPQLGNTRVRYFFGDEYEIVRVTGKPGVAYQLLGFGKTPHDPPRRPFQQRSRSPKRGRKPLADEAPNGSRRRTTPPRP